MSDEAIETFKKAARPYGLRYLHLHDSNGDGLSTLMVRGEDAAVINRLIERNKLAVLTDVTQAEIERDPSKAADINEPIPEVVIGKDQVRVQDAVKEARGSAQDLLKPEPNPTKGQTERKSRLSSDGLNPKWNKRLKNFGQMLRRLLIRTLQSESKKSVSTILNFITKTTRCSARRL